MKWDGKIGLTLATVVALFSITGAPSAMAQAKNPKIVFILVDNVYGDRDGCGFIRGCPSSARNR